MTNLRRLAALGLLSFSVLFIVPRIVGAEPYQPVASSNATQTDQTQESIVITNALFVGLEAKPGKEKELGQFLQTGLNLARQEGTTPVWFALRLGPSTFGIFDAFTDEAGRQAHLNGSIAQALGANAPNLLAQPPSIERIDDVRIIQFPPRAQRVQSLTSLDRERCSVWPAPRRRRGISV